VKNAGGIPSGVPSATITGADPSAFLITSDGCKAVLDSGATCQVGVTFQAPTTLGAKAAQLDVTANGGGSAKATLTGISSYVEITPSTHDFGQASISAAAKPIGYLNLKHLGNANSPTLRVAATLSGADLADFAILNQCPDLAPGDTCQLDVQFAARTTGAKVARVDVAVSDVAAGAARGTASASLVGTAIP
jgi:hypothetical protein